MRGVKGAAMRMWLIALLLAAPVAGLAHEGNADETNETADGTTDPGGDAGGGATVTVREAPGDNDGANGGDDGISDGARALATFLLLLAAAVGIAFVAIAAWRRR